MLDLYFGSGKGKTCVCMGAALRAAAKDKKVLYVEFIKSIDDFDKKALELKCMVTVSSAPVDFELTVATAQDSKAQASKIFRKLFDSAVRTVLANKYNMLVLDGVFDIVEKGFIPESEVYEFLSNAPDNIEIVCSGINVSDKCMDLFSHAVQLVDTKEEEKTST